MSPHRNEPCRYCGAQLYPADRTLARGAGAGWQGGALMAVPRLNIPLVLEEKDRGKLLFIGGRHPSGDVSGGRFDALM